MELNFQLATKAMPQFGFCQKDTEFKFNMIESRIARDIQLAIDDLPLRICAKLWEFVELEDINGIANMFETS